MSKKVIIIGSGLGGLSCGYILQKNGYDVTILEQGVQIGGCLQCFYRHGAKFETGMHFIGSAAPNQTMNRIMKYFGLSSIQLSELDRNAYNTIHLVGENFKFANGKEEFIEQMASYFPSQKDSLNKYIDIINRIASASTLNSLTSEHRDLAANTKYQMLSINSVLDELFTDRLLKHVLVGDLPLYAAEFNKTPFSQHAFIMDFYNQSAYRIVGGSDIISKTLAQQIQDLGGQVLKKKKVVKIECNSTQAVGVRLEDETFYQADYIISTIHPNRLVDLLDTTLIRPAFKYRISNLPQTAAGFAVYVQFKENTMPYMNTNYYGYEGDSPWGCEYYSDETWPKGFLYMHMCHQDRAQWAKSGVILSYMNISDVEQWKGSKIGARGESYEKFKNDHALKLIDKVNNHIKGFKESINTFYTSTPLTYLDYTGTEGGSMYGVAKDINLGPAGRVPYKTKIPNLFLAGQNVNSHGMMGVIVGTIVTCSELIGAENIYKEIELANI